jgi:hypothetical protein
METSTFNLSPDRIQEILEELGYRLTDRGKYWHANAAYRNGDNQTALQIWKNSGVWRDFVEGTVALPFVKLLEVHFGSNDKSIIEKYLSIEYHNPQPRTYTQEDRLDMEKIYEESMLEDLFPHYDFYNKKGISTDILMSLKGGLATQGQMYQRFVFPIYNSDGRIHGFSGRDMAQRENAPKWKHMGRKTNWIYPYYIPASKHLNTQKAIEDSRSVIIVESIGDLLSLHQNGFQNALVSFGLDISSKLLCHLISLDVDRIIISFNNDYDKTENRGARAAIKNYLKLLNHFDFDKIFVCLPTKTDFGEMNSQDFIDWDEKCKCDLNNRAKQILSFAKKMQEDGLLTKEQKNNIKILEDNV